MSVETIKSGPIVVKNLFSDNTHSQIVDFLNERVPLMSLGYDDTEFVRKYAHNVPFFVDLHHKLTDFASDAFGVAVKPSYAFLSMYEEGGTCPVHIDRPQCRFTIDYLIRSSVSDPWPICIGEQMSDEEREVWQIKMNNEALGPDVLQERIEKEHWTKVLINPNDALLYSGTHSWHYRPEKLNGTADLVFFHFVHEDFDGPLN